MEQEENIEELKRLFYTNSLTQYGKRKLINYYEQQIQKLKDNSIPKEKVIREMKKLDDMTQDPTKEYYYANYRYTMNILERLLEEEYDK